MIKKSAYIIAFCILLGGIAWILAVPKGELKFATSDTISSPLSGKQKQGLKRAFNDALTKIDVARAELIVIYRFMKISTQMMNLIYGYRIIQI